MNTNENTGISKSEKVTRFVCGGLLGFFVGLYFIAKWAIVSPTCAVAIWTVAVLACSSLALKYGDEFWYAMFGRHR